MTPEERKHRLAALHDAMIADEDSVALSRRWTVERGFPSLKSFNEEATVAEIEEAEIYFGVRVPPRPVGRLDPAMDLSPEGIRAAFHDPENTAEVMMMSSEFYDRIKAYFDRAASSEVETIEHLSIGEPPVRRTLELVVPISAEHDGREHVVRRVVVGDDPINPEYYAGDNCAQIGERMTANSYQVLKYHWRLGQKDEPCQEIGKSLWYLDREIRLIEEIGSGRIPGSFMPSDDWLAERLVGTSDHTTEVAGRLWIFNRHGDINTLRKLRAYIESTKGRYGGCTGMGRGMEP